MAAQARRHRAGIRRPLRPHRRANCASSASTRAASSPRAARSKPVGKGDATFKQLFTSWKKLDNLQTARSPFRPTSRSRPPPSPRATASAPTRSRAAPRCTPGSTLPGPVGTPIYATADGVVSERRLQQRRLRQPRQARPWPRHRNPLRPPVDDPRPRRPARHPRPDDRPHGLDRPLDRQPPPL